MRIRIVKAADPYNDGIAEKTYEALTNELKKIEGLELTDENPDIIHIIGKWNTTTTKIANDAYKRHIALVHTPLGSLSPWYKPTAAGLKLSANATRLIATGTMEQEILNVKRKTHLCMIPNSVTTVLTTAEKMAEQHLILYKEAIEATEKKIWEETAKKIELLNETDECIVEICKNIMYAQYLHQRGSIPQQFIDKLSKLMAVSNYDEDHLSDVLKLINLYPFTQRLEYVMQESSTLTEGFMPVPLKEDAAAKDMLKLITNYK